jgi:hypothetical protein
MFPWAFAAGGTALGPRSYIPAMGLWFLPATKMHRNIVDHLAVDNAGPHRSPGRVSAINGNWRVRSLPGRQAEYADATEWPNLGVAELAALALAPERNGRIMSPPCPTSSSSARWRVPVRSTTSCARSASWVGLCCPLTNSSRGSGPHLRQPRRPHTPPATSHPARRHAAVRLEAGMAKADRNLVRPIPIINSDRTDETDDRFLGISARHAAHHSPRRVRLLQALAGTRCPGRQAARPVHHVDAGPEKTEGTGYKKGA